MAGSEGGRKGMTLYTAGKKGQMSTRLYGSAPSMAVINT